VIKAYTEKNCALKHLKEEVSRLERKGGGVGAATETYKKRNKQQNTKQSKKPKRIATSKNAEKVGPKRALLGGKKQEMN